MTGAATTEAEASFETKPYQLHLLKNGPSEKVLVSKAEALHMYRQMLTIRLMENEVEKLYRGKEIRGGCHLYTGQEACAVGIKAALAEKDTVITSYRVHGWAFVMGGNANGVIAEVLGRKSGLHRGKAGSMHMYPKNLYGGNAIVGDQVPVGAGLAFAHKYKGDGGVNIALYGDGCANQGQVFETFNMAKLWQLPCIFVCENNGLAITTTAERSSANTDFYKRGDYFPGIRVDGTDVLAVREATRFARAFCHQNGPILLELITHRFTNHVMHVVDNPERTPEELERIMKLYDPITIFRKRLVASNLLNEEESQAIVSEVENSISEAVAAAKADTEIGVNELAADIYVTNLEGTIRGIMASDRLTHTNVGLRMDNE